MFKIRKNNKNSKLNDKNINNNLAKDQSIAFDDTKLILELVSQIQNQTDQLIKEEGFSTVNFNSLLEGEDYTKKQIQNVQNNLESVVESSDLTKELLMKIIKGLTDSSDDLLKAKIRNQTMVTEMNNLIDVFAQFNLLFGELQAEYNQIENLATVISGIANKTKMLSLNASIEAARAGEYGRGFSVVAEEINKLSENTQSNAKSIMSSLGNMTDIILKLNSKTIEGTNMLPSTQGMINDSNIAFNNITSVEQQLLHSLHGVIDSQDDNIFKISEINTDLLHIINKADSDNTQYKKLVLGVQKKADYYLHLLHYLKQIEVLKEQRLY